MMRAFRAVRRLPIVLLLSGSVGIAQESGDDTTKRRLEEQERELKKLQEEIRALRDELHRPAAKAESEDLEGEVNRFVSKWPKDGQVGGDVPPDLSIPRTATTLEERYGTKGGIYSKPFLRRAAQSTYLGGYMDLEYRDAQKENRTFSQHRFVPFIYSDVSEQVKVAAEIEFEFGGTDSEGGGGETNVEFATVDYILSEAFGFRAGAILVPLGKFNLIHDSPVNDLTDRPLVDRFIIPTTFTEAGLGFFGSTYPFGEAKFDYEAYLVNGFRGLVEDSSSPTGFTSLFNDQDGLRDGRGSLETDNNNSTAGVGRVAYSPFLGSEVGLSAHAGKYDDKGENWLVIYAVDAMLQPGRFSPALNAFELQGEFARADISRNQLARDSGVPGDMWGIYGQVSYHFMLDGLREALPSVFQEESTFTAVARIDHVDLDSEKTERVTVGLNFRPIEDTVFKFDYQFNFEDWNRGAIPNDAFVFSIATYF